MHGGGEHIGRFLPDNGPWPVAFPRSAPRTMCCGTTRSGLNEAGRHQVPGLPPLSNQYVVGRCLGVLDKNIEVAASPNIPVRAARIRDRVFRADGLRKRVFHRGIPSRVLVQCLHVRVGWCGVEIEIVLFYVFSVVALTVVQTEKRSLRKGSHPFHRERAKQSLPSRSVIPSRPSSPHR